MVWNRRQARSGAEALAAGLPALLVEARRVAASLRVGSHGRQRSGPGDSFWQFRRYQAGDPASAIDWRQSARSEPLFVRETEWTAPQTVWIWLDGSPSMHWSSDERIPRKYHQAALIALALALLLLEGGERVGFLGADHRPLSGPAMFEGMVTRLVEGAPSAMLPPPGPGGRPCLIALSDFLTPPEELAAGLKAWAAAGATGHLVRIEDPAERDFPYAGRIRFEGPEGEADLLVPRAESLRNAYLDRLAAHHAALAGLAASLGWRCLAYGTDLAAADCLGRLYTGLAGR